MSQDNELKAKVLEYNIADLEHERAALFVDLYVNHTQAQPSFNDLRMVMGAIVDNRGKREAPPVIEERVAVTMAWEHAKSLRDLLTRMIDAYEKENGLLRVRPKE